MSHPPASIANVRWSELCPWLILVRAARVSLLARVLGLALAGVVATQLGWSLIERVMLAPSQRPAMVRLTDKPLPSVGAGAAIGAGSDLALQAHVYGGPLLRGWAWPMQPVQQLLARDNEHGWLVYAPAVAWSIAVWALFGAAIARIAALHLAHGETIGPITALKSAARKWASTAGAPVCALIGLALLALPLVVTGLMVRLDFFAMLLGLFWIVAIIFGVAIAVIAIGLALGWPLMWAAVAVERTDAFDGISRAYAYVFQRPLHALFYLMVAGALGLLGQAAVGLFTSATLTATQWAVSAGAGEERFGDLLLPSEVPRDEPVGVMESAGSGAIRFWTASLLWLAAAYPMAYVFPAATGIYLLLRRQIDSTELGEVVFDGDQPDRGLPPLVNDPATGIPRVADPRPATSAEPTTAAPPTIVVPPSTEPAPPTIVPTTVGHPYPGPEVGPPRTSPPRDENPPASGDAGAPTTRL